MKSKALLGQLTPPLWYLQPVKTNTARLQISSRPDHYMVQRLRIKGRVQPADFSCIVKTLVVFAQAALYCVGENWSESLLPFIGTSPAHQTSSYQTHALNRLSVNP